MDRVEIPPQALVHINNLDIKQAVFNLTINSINNKPKQALWTSNWKDNILESGWIHWNCFVYEGYSKNALLENCLYKVYPKKEVKVFELATLEDLEKMPKVDAQKAFDGEDEEYIPPFYSNFFNYKALKDQGYDGFHITAEAANHSGLGLNRLLYNFDCESSVWFHLDWIDYIETIDDNLFETLKDYLPQSVG